jgi:hypothetical protein
LLSGVIILQVIDGRFIGLQMEYEMAVLLRDRIILSSQAFSYVSITSSRVFITFLAPKRRLDALGLVMSFNGGVIYTELSLGRSCWYLLSEGRVAFSSFK